MLYSIRSALQSYITSGGLFSPCSRDLQLKMRITFTMSNGSYKFLCALYLQLKRRSLG